MAAVKADLAASLESGAHALLHRLVGHWEGRARLWLQPNVLYCEDVVRGEVTAVHGGRWVRHAYETRIDGVDESGTALIGYVLDRRIWQVAWVDTWHTGTEVFLSEGPHAEDGSTIVVATAYAETADPGPWRWRSEFEQGDETFYVRHYNVTPAGDEAIAVEFAYARA